MIDIKKHEELRRQYNPDGSDLRSAQIVMVDLLLFLDKVCKEHRLTYWLGSGTLLGAARHQGFIPWDDDLDVCMPREDAKILKTLMGNKVFENHIILQNQTTDWNYLNCGWMTLRDIKTEYIQNDNIHKALKYRGVQIDIFEMESDVSLWKKKIVNVIHNILVGGLVKKSDSRIIRTIANINARIIDNIITPVLRLIKTKNEKITYAIGNPFKKSFSRNIIYPLNQITFEKHLFPCPRDVNSYLKNIYGDWEKIPDEMNIRTHNVSFRFV